MVTENQDEDSKGVAKVFFVFWVLVALSFMFPAHLPVSPVAQAHPAIKVDSGHNLG